MPRAGPWCNPRPALDRPTTARCYSRAGHVVIVPVSPARVDVMLNPFLERTEVEQCSDSGWMRDLGVFHWFVFIRTFIVTVFIGCAGSQRSKARSLRLFPRWPLARLHAKSGNPGTQATAQRNEATNCFVFNTPANTGTVRRRPARGMSRSTSSKPPGKTTAQTAGADHRRSQVTMCSYVVISISCCSHLTFTLFARILLRGLGWCFLSPFHFSPLALVG